MNHHIHGFPPEAKTLHFAQEGIINPAPPSSPLLLCSVANKFEWHSWESAVCNWKGLIGMPGHEEQETYWEGDELPQRTTSGLNDCVISSTLLCNTPTICGGYVPQEWQQEKLAHGSIKMPCRHYPTETYGWKRKCDGCTYTTCEYIKTHWWSS